MSYETSDFTIAPIMSSSASGVTWISDFLPAIRNPEDPSRQPGWFILNYATHGERCLLRLLDHIGMPHHSFTFRHQPSRSKPPTTRHWLPGGYLFLNFDPARDRWQQVLHMPHVRAILGDKRPRPLPLAGDCSMAGLRLRLPAHLPKNDANTSISPGTEIVIRSGPFTSFPGTVIRCPDRKHVEIIAMIFGRPCNTLLAIRDVEVTRK